MRFPAAAAIAIITVLHTAVATQERAPRASASVLSEHHLEALPTMGWSNVTEVRVGKLVRMTLDAEDEASGRAQAEEIGQRLLANPVIEDVRVLAVREAV